jgi:hypothetical protein
MPQLVQHANYLQENRDSIPARTRGISVIYRARIDPIAHGMDPRGHFKGYKVAGGKNENSPQSSVMVKRGRNDTITSPTCLEGKVVTI